MADLRTILGVVGSIHLGFVVDKALDELDRQVQPIAGFKASDVIGTLGGLAILALSYTGRLPPDLDIPALAFAGTLTTRVWSIVDQATAGGQAAAVSVAPAPPPQPQPPRAGGQGVVAIVGT